jgi:hypothetical protein
VQDVALSWQQAACLTAGLAVAGAALSVARNRRARWLAPFVRETAMISGLYAVWQLAGTLSLGGTGGALSRAKWIERVERDCGLPSEASVQHALTGHSAFLAQFANLYYATMHFGTLFVFLLWLFVRHRDRYREVRRVLALTTLACLLIQLVPVAPPRMLPAGYGFVDTASKYGQSVYGHGFDADQLSAMPSVHVAWAVLVAWACVRIGGGPWRWAAVVHAVLTVLVVVSTANHFWADGIVAVVVLALCAVVCHAAERAIARLRLGDVARVGLSTAADGAILPLEEAR